MPDYTTLVSSAFGGTSFSQATLNAGAPVNITTTADDDENVLVASGNAAGAAAGSVLNFYVGAANADSADTGGTMTSADEIVVIYQVLID